MTEKIADLPIDWAGGYGCGTVECPAFQAVALEHPQIVLPFHGFLSHCMGCRRFRGFKYPRNRISCTVPVRFSLTGDPDCENQQASHVRCLRMKS